MVENGNKVIGKGATTRDTRSAVVQMPSTVKAGLGWAGLGCLSVAVLSTPMLFPPL